jgi:hypothetical protein
MYEEKRLEHDRTASQASAARESHLTVAFMELETALERQAKIAAEMEQRLVGILRNEPEETNKDGQTERTVVPVAARIQESVKRLQRLEAQYSSILRRLEI